MLTVTDYSKIADTPQGYTIALDLTSLLADTVSRIEGLYNSKVYQSYTEVAPEVIASYLNFTTAAIAFNKADDQVTIFFNKTFLPYSGSTQFNIEGLRKAQDVTSLLDNCDVPDKDKDLLKNYLSEEAYQAFNYPVPRSVKSDIQKGERGIARES